MNYPLSFFWIITIAIEQSEFDYACSRTNLGHSSHWRTLKLKSRPCMGSYNPRDPWSLSAEDIPRKFSNLHSFQPECGKTSSLLDSLNRSLCYSFSQWQHCSISRHTRHTAQKRWLWSYIFHLYRKMSERMWNNSRISCKFLNYPIKYWMLVYTTTVDSVEGALWLASQTPNILAILLPAMCAGFAPKNIVIVARINVLKLSFGAILTHHFSLY